MYNYVLFWISYLLFELQLIWFFKRFFRDTPSRACKTRCESLETNIPPYVLNKYRIEVKIIFVLAAYLVLLCEFFWEFSIFRFCRPLVDIYWHPLLRFFCFMTILREIWILPIYPPIWCHNGVTLRQYVNQIMLRTLLKIMVTFIYSV